MGTVSKRTLTKEEEEEETPEPSKKQKTEEPPSLRRKASQRLLSAIINALDGPIPVRPLCELIAGYADFRIRCDVVETPRFWTANPNDHTLMHMANGEFYQFYTATVDENELRSAPCMVRKMSAGGFPVNISGGIANERPPVNVRAVPGDPTSVYALCRRSIYVISSTEMKFVASTPSLDILTHMSVSHDGAHIIAIGPHQPVAYTIDTKTGKSVQTHDLENKLEFPNPSTRDRSMPRGVEFDRVHPRRFYYSAFKDLYAVSEGIGTRVDYTQFTGYQGGAASIIDMASTPGDVLLIFSGTTQRPRIGALYPATREYRLIFDGNISKMAAAATATSTTVEEDDGVCVPGGVTDRTKQRHSESPLIPDGAIWLFTSALRIELSLNAIKALAAKSRLACATPNAITADDVMNTTIPEKDYLLWVLKQ